MNRKRVLMGYSVILSIILLACNCQNPHKTSDHPSSETKSSSTLDTLPINLMTDAVDTITKDYIMGKFEPKHHPDFVSIEIPYADRTGLWLRTEAYDAFREMYTAAKEDSVTLTILSATRNFEYQQGIWERKWNGKTILSDGKNATEIIHPYRRAKEILKWSSMPGSSRHHWGTDIDLNAFENSYFASGQGKKTYEWLQENAITYGFGQSYTPRDSLRPHGYNEEKWHWSYLPLSIPLTRKAENLLSNSDFEGFDGAESADSVDILNNYILGINPEIR